MMEEEEEETSKQNTVVEKTVFPSYVSLEASPRKCNLSFSLNFDYDDGNNNASSDSETPELQIDISEVDNYKPPAKKYKRDTVEETCSVINEVEEEIERQLDAKAAKTNLTATNVKNILKHVITNEHVMAMVKNRLHNSKDDVLFEPKLTRAKAKELAVAQLNIPWSITPIKKTSSEVQALIEEELPEDSSDEEYNPEQDKQSDDEGEIENSASSDANSQPTTPTDKCDSSLIEQSQSLDVQYDPEGIFKIPGIPHVPTEEESIGQRTRSKLCLSETPLEQLEQAFIPPDITTDMYDMDEKDEVWKSFLKEFNQPLSQEPVIEDDPEADPEYNILEDEEIEFLDKEELRADKAVKISRKEVNNLYAELLEYNEIFPYEEEEIPKKKKPSENTNSSMENPMNFSVTDFLPTYNEPDLPNLINSDQRKLLTVQLRQHVQFMVQHFVMTYMLPELHHFSKICKQNLYSIKYLSSGPNSAFNAINLPDALKLVSEWENKFLDSQFSEDFNKSLADDNMVKKVYLSNKFKYVPEFHPELKKLLMDSKALMYPQLLPEIPFKNELNKFVRRPYLKSEENLIAMGLEQFQPFVASFKPKKFKKLEDVARLITQYLTPCREPIRLLHYIKKRRFAKEENPIKYYFEKGSAPRMIHYILLECDLKAPKEQPMNLLPSVWQIYLNNRERKIDILKRKHILNSYNNLMNNMPPKILPMNQRATKNLLKENSSKNETNCDDLNTVLNCSIKQYESGIPNSLKTIATQIHKEEKGIDHDQPKEVQLESNVLVNSIVTKDFQFYTKSESVEEKRKELNNKELKEIESNVHVNLFATKDSQFYKKSESVEEKGKKLDNKELKEVESNVHVNSIDTKDSQFYKKPERVEEKDKKLDNGELKEVESNVNLIKRKSLRLIKKSERVEEKGRKLDNKELEEIESNVHINAIKGKSLRFIKKSEAIQKKEKEKVEEKEKKIDENEAKEIESSNAAVNSITIKSSRFNKKSEAVQEQPQLRKTTPRLAKTKSAQNMKLMAQVLGPKSLSSNCNTVKSKEKNESDKNSKKTLNLPKLDNEDEIAELMLASTTIKKDYISRKKAKEARELENIKRVLESENLLNEEERCSKFAASYLQKLHLTLESNNPETFRSVIKLYLDYYEKLESINQVENELPFSEENSSRTLENEKIIEKTEMEKDAITINLYRDVCEKLSKYPELCRNFLLFLKPHQAAMVDEAVEYIMLQKMREFINVAQIYFAKQPSRIAKLMQGITQLSSDAQTTLEQVHTIMDPILKGHPLVMDLFLQTLPSAKPPESLFASHMFENLTCPVGPHDKNKIYSEDAPEVYENIELSGLTSQEDPYGGENCRCDCHYGDDTSCKSTSEHCVSCGTRFLNGKIYLQTSEGLRPAKIIFPGADEEKLENIARVSLVTVDKLVPSISTKRKRSSKNEFQADEQYQKLCISKNSPTKENEEDGKLIVKSKKIIKSLSKSTDQRKSLRQSENDINQTALPTKKMRMSQHKNKREKKNNKEANDYTKSDESIESKSALTETMKKAASDTEMKVPSNYECSSNKIDSFDNAQNSVDLSTDIVTKPWKREEDMILLQAIKEEYSENSFARISETLEDRTIDQVKERCETLLSLLQKMV